MSDLTPEMEAILMGEEPAKPPAPAQPEMSQVPEAARQRVQRVQDAGMSPVAVTGDGGVVYRAPSGEFGIVNEVGSRQLSEDEAQSIMAGSDTYGSVAQSDFYNEVIRQHPVEARVSKFLQGGLGFGEYVDEARGKIWGDQAREGTLLLQRAMDEERPVESLGLRFAGGLASGATLGLAAPGLALPAAQRSVATQAVAGAAALGAGGAIEGAISGYGRGETPEERKRYAINDAMLGGAAGVTLGLAAPLPKKVVAYGIDKIKGTPVSRLARDLGIREDAAANLRRMAASDDFDTMMRRMADDEARVVDATEGFRRQLDVAVNDAGPAMPRAIRNTTERVTRSATALRETLDDAMGAPVGITPRLRALREGGAEARDAAWKAAYQTELPTSAAPYRRLEGLVTQVPDSVLNSVNRRIKMDTTGTLPRQIRATITDAGDVVFDELPNTHQLQLIAQELEKLAKPGMESGALGGMNAYSREYRNLAKAIRDNLKRINPAFRAASDAFADEAQIADAIQMGGDLLASRIKMSDVADEVRNYSPAQRAAAAQGMRDYIDDLLARASPSLARADDASDAVEAVKAFKLLTNRSNQTKMKLILGEQRTNAIVRQAREVARAAEARNAFSLKSPTEPREAMRAGMAAEGAGDVDVLDVAGGNVGALRSVVRALVGKSPRAIREANAQMYDDMVRVLTEIQGPEARRALQILRRSADAEMRALTQREANLIASALGAASIGGSYQGIEQGLQQRLSTTGPR